MMIVAGVGGGVVWAINIPAEQYVVGRYKVLFSNVAGRLQGGIHW